MQNKKSKTQNTKTLKAYLLDDQVGFILRKANQLHASIFSNLIPNDLTPTKFSALAKLYELGSLSQNELGRFIAMDAANIKGVIDVIEFDDSDKTCIDGIKKAKSLYKNNIIKFANGGDRNNETTPEKEFCDKNDIETLFGIGGNDKSNSSSWILKKWKE